ncbi:MAG: cytochrome c oxidase subunit II [Beggiatoa sp. IS2]|nr:MAG: cytochrome c oxidase subunit II [Beggiatoa sp. IS2]
MVISSAKRMATALTIGVISSPAFAEYALNFQTPVSEIATKVYNLHMTIFYICMAIAFVVFGAMIYSIINHRKSKGAKAAQFHESTTVEIIWTIIPFIILIVMAIPATKTLIAMEESTDKGDVTIKITASQFKWHYDYLNEGINFISALATPEDQIYGAAEKGEHYLLEVDNPIVVPIKTKIRFLLTAADVLHAWWVPAISVKKDAIPGFINQMWTVIDKPGTYRGQCAELCGAKHGFMPIVLEAMEPEKYQAWVKEKQAIFAAEKAKSESGADLPKGELMAKGETVYKANCAVCHQASGEGGGPFPALKGSKIATGAVEDHIKIVLHGKAAMPPFKGSMNDLDLAAIITYERNAWGNVPSDGKDVVQPGMIKGLR